MWTVRIVLFTDAECVEVPVNDWNTGCQAVAAAQRQFPGQIARGEVLPPVRLR